MITRNGLISLLVLLAGLCAGILVSRIASPQPIHDEAVAASSHTISVPSVSARDSLHFGHDSLLVDRVGRFMELSPEVRAIGLGGPPVNRLLDGDILGASSFTLSHVYKLSRNGFPEIHDEGLEAVREAVALRDLLLEVEDRVEQNQADFQRLLDETAYEIELFRLLDYYRQYVMQYYRWIDAGEPSAASLYKIAQGQFTATLNYLQEKYGDELKGKDLDFRECRQGLASVSNTPRSIRWARVLSVIILFLLLMGIPGAIRDRAHRKFSGTLFFSSLFRPYHISTLDAWHGTGRLLLLQLSIFLLSLVVFSSFSSLLFPMAAGVPGLAYVLAFMLLVRPGRRWKECGITLLGPMLALMLLFMVPVAVRGPHWFWYQLWTSALFRTLFFGLFFMCLFRMFQVHYLMAARWGKGGGILSFSSLVAAVGVPLLLCGLALQGFGLEESLAALNMELLLLPSGLAEHMGIATHLNLPAELPRWLFVLASGIILCGLLMYLAGLRQNRKRN